MSRSDRPRMAGIRSTADPRWDTAAKNTQATSGVALPNNRRGYAGADHAWPSPECRGQAGWPAVQWGAGDSASRAAIRRRHPPARQAAVSHTSNCLSIGLVEFMAWYDLFSNFYDYTVELVYRRYRPGVVDALGLEAGQFVLDLACGTGPNQPHLVEAVQGCGHVFGVDFSDGMLKRARKNAEREGWSNVHLLQLDARDLTLANLEAACGEQVELSGVVVTLGLSVIPDWEAVFKTTFDLLAPGGRYVIFDVHAERWVPQTWLVEKVAQADPTRESFKALEQCCEDFSFAYLPGSPHVHGGRPFLASGCKPGGIEQ